MIINVTGKGLIALQGPDMQGASFRPRETWVRGQLFEGQGVFEVFVFPSVRLVLEHG